MTAPALPRRRVLASADALGLSPRERTALEHAADGLDVEGIALEMGIYPNTVAHHLRNAVTKLRARNLMHAVAIAVRYGAVL